MEITVIGKEAAVPFIADYARRWNLAFSEDGADNVLWFGAWDNSCLRAVLGLQDITSDPDAFFVNGIYGDGSGKDKRALSALINALHDLPHMLTGRIHMPNLAMLRVAARRGWVVDASVPKLGCFLVYRPGKVAA